MERDTVGGYAPVDDFMTSGIGMQGEDLYADRSIPDGGKYRARIRIQNECGVFGPWSDFVYYSLGGAEVPDPLPIPIPSPFARYIYRTDEIETDLQREHACEARRGVYFPIFGSLTNVCIITQLVGEDRLPPAGPWEYVGKE
jgi:hypothetical protein